MNNLNRSFMKNLPKEFIRDQTCLDFVKNPWQDKKPKASIDYSFPSLKRVLPLPISSAEIKQLIFSERLLISVEREMLKKKKNPPAPENLDESAAAPKDLVNMETIKELGAICICVQQLKSDIKTHVACQFSSNDMVLVTSLHSVVNRNLELLEETKTEKQYSFNELENAMPRKKKENELIITRASLKMFEISKKVVDRQYVTKRIGLITKKTHGDIVLDGGVIMLMRFIVFTKFVGVLRFWGVDIEGNLMRCILYCGCRKKFMIHGKVENLFKIKRRDIREGFCDELSSLYFYEDCRLAMQRWMGSPFIIHVNPLMHEERYDDCQLLEAYFDDIKPV